MEKPEKYKKLLDKVLRPARYTGGEYNEIIKNTNNVDIRFAFAFPDMYEIGMSNLGMKILYGVLNSLDYVWCERVFAPAADMASELRVTETPLYALESGDSLRLFDFLGFTLQYELCYTGVLYMLDLAGIPYRADERTADSAKPLAEQTFPLVIAGGPCTYNPEPVADFFDIICIGEGEELLPELMELYRDYKMAGRTKGEFLLAAAKIRGIYVPSFYGVKYDDEKIVSFEPVTRDIPGTIHKRIIKDLDKAYFPHKPVIPNIEAVHDRITLEIQRGCIRGCRFCQAGYVYRPNREKAVKTLCGDALLTYKNTGYDEVSLLSLSSSDYSELYPLADGLLEWTARKKVNIAMPSMRIDAFSKELYEKVSGVRQSTLTFAPEAGSQRLRDVINKNLTEENITETLSIAYASGSENVKLYFMIGLPGESDEDITAIAQLAKKAVDLYYEKRNGRNGKGIKVSISVATFVPKPFTPFQFEPQISFAEITRRQNLLRGAISSKKISYSYHDAKISRLEAVFARGDRRLSEVIIAAYEDGAVFDGWDEMFRFDIWQEAFKKCGIGMETYAEREYSADEILPWDFIDIGVKKEFFISENKRAKKTQTSTNCREGCMSCGADTLFGENFSGEGVVTCCPLG